MKRYFLSSVFFFCLVGFGSAQVWTTGLGKIYTMPDTVRVGIGTANPQDLLHINNGALRIGLSTAPASRATNVLKFGDNEYVKIGEWEADDALSFQANQYNFVNGNVGIGVADPAYKLDVNGKLFLRTADARGSWGISYLQWALHSLVMGTPIGTPCHTSIELMSGGSDTYADTLFSRIRMYSAFHTDQKLQKIDLCTEGNCWFMNTGNFGIGTAMPAYKLDVNGTIRANEIIVNTTGADYVFDESYHLPSLSEVERYIAEHKHLPEVQSAEQVQQEGMSVGEMQTLLLQKIEELTLYIIEQDKRIKQLEQEQNQ